VDSPPAAVETTAPPNRPWQLGAAASGQAVLSSASPTWGAAGSVELSWGSVLGASLEVFGQGRRDTQVGAGRAGWSRLSFALGPTVTLALGEAFAAAATVAAVAGPFFASGSGFDDSRA